MRFGALAAFLAVVAAAVAGAVFSPLDASAGASGTCSAGKNGSPGYAYAGHQSDRISHGVRAIVTPLVEPKVVAGHVAGWIGVGGPGQGPNGSSVWLQTGIAAIPGMPMMLYVEITRAGANPKFVPIEYDLVAGRSLRLAVLEMSHRPDHWRVWVNNQPVTEPIVLPGSTKRWRPIVTAESWNNGTASCNAFAFRFEQVGVARTKGGSWRPLVSGYRFLDQGYNLRQLRTPEGPRLLSAEAEVQPYAFEAASA